MCWGILFLENIGLFFTAIAVWYTVRVLYSFLFQSSMRIFTPSKLRAVFFLVIDLFVFTLKSFVVVWVGVLPDHIEILFNTVMALLVLITFASFIMEMSKDESK